MLSILLTQRYGDRITQDSVDAEGNTVVGNQPVFLSVAADAILRKLARPPIPIQRQIVANAQVMYNERANIASWFLPEELVDLDALAWGGTVGTRTVRMSAPDAVRFGNLLHREPRVMEED